MACDPVSIACIAKLEFSMVARATRTPIVALLGVGFTILVLQEPRSEAMEVRAGFTASSIEAILVVMSSLLPLVWSATRIRREVELVVDGMTTSLAQAMGAIAFVAVVEGAAIAVLITVERIHAAVAAPMLLRLLLVAAPFAAFGVALVSERVGALRHSLAWILLSATSLGILGLGVPIPVDRLLGDPGVSPGLEILASACLAVLAGVSISTAGIVRRSTG